MLNQPTIEKLQTMKLHGMAEAFREQIETADSSQLSFEERFGLLVDRQWTWKEGRALTRRLQLAKFKERGVVEDINYQHPRGLDRKLIAHSPPVSGLACITMSCWLGPLVSVRPGWRVPWRTRPAGMVSSPYIKGWRNCFVTWSRHEPTAPSASSC
jgi:hypothetical protein